MKNRYFFTGRSWRGLGVILAASWVDLEASGGDLGAFWGDLGAVLGDLGAPLGLKAIFGSSIPRLQFDLGSSALPQVLRPVWLNLLALAT